MCIRDRSHTDASRSKKSKKRTQEQIRASVKVSELLRTDTVPEYVKCTLDQFRAKYPRKRIFNFDLHDTVSALISLYTHCFFDSLIHWPLEKINDFRRKVKYNTGKKKSWTITDDARIKNNFLNAVKEVKGMMSWNEELKEWPKDKIEHCEPFIKSSLDKYSEETGEEFGKETISNMKKFNEAATQLFELKITWIYKEEVKLYDSVDSKREYLVYPVEDGELQVFYSEPGNRKQDENVLIRNLFKCLEKALKMESPKYTSHIKKQLEKFENLNLNADTREIVNKYSERCLKMLKSKSENSYKEQKKPESSNPEMDLGTRQDAIEDARQEDLVESHSGKKVHRDRVKKKQKKESEDNSKQKNLCMLCMRTDRYVSRVQIKCHEKCELYFCERCLTNVNKMINCILPLNAIACPNCHKYGPELV
eukprot:TRINITY_DN10058_c0_g2_i2.p1 TRINITY_DN10058_c0_g2~~TRINITY_DN10058_c0_g2_i2.p1  ORF type:complete len:422 (-),score=48.48 TRINITY_DN10058_c0_g2_i2:58-1323(-)